MTTAIKRRRGTTAQHATFTGLEGELTIDTTKDTVVVHDGATAGGFPLAKESQATTNVAITGGSINGTTVGASTVSTGAFTALAYSSTLTGGTGVINIGSGQIYKDTSGNVGIGTSSPSYKLDVRGGSIANINSGADALFIIGEGVGTAEYGFLRWDRTNNVLQLATDAAAPVAFWTNNTERMRIDSSGNLLIGTTSADIFSNNNGFAFLPNSSTAGGASLGIGHATGTSSGYSYIVFNYAGGAIGSISQTGTTAVLYNTTSDYRLKTDISPIQNGLSTIESLNPVNFTWVDGRKDDGFLAHEIQAVIPNCVTGEKDAVNEDGTPKYQQMDNSGVIPFLVKAIQEQQTLINNLTTRLNALEGK